jgi:hypothetical protein
MALKGFLKIYMKKRLIILLSSLIVFSSAIPVFAQEDNIPSRANPQPEKQSQPADEPKNQTIEIEPPSSPNLDVDDVPKAQKKSTSTNASSSARPTPTKKITIQNTTLELPTDVPPPPALLVQPTPIPQKEETDANAIKEVKPILFEISVPLTINIYSDSRLSSSVSYFLLLLSGVLLVTGITLVYVEKISHFMGTNKATDMKKNMIIRLS